MSNSKGREKRNKLSQEILGLFCAAAAISIFFFFFFSVTADSLVLSYSEKHNIIYTGALGWTINSWIQSISFFAAIFIFVVLFLFLLGQKIAYLKEIIRGIEALRIQRLDYEISLEGNNEFTELAEGINELSKTERELRLRENQMKEEKEELIRALSHDIRTPLTAILSYSEYMKEKAGIERQEMDDYIALIQQKAEQIKALTNRLLDGGVRTLVEIKNGKVLMEQLADEWESILEDRFKCEVNLEDCPSFAGEFDIQELRRVFDNLASNVEKYADEKKSVFLKIYEKEGHLRIEQKNKRRKKAANVESRKIGIESIRKITEQYGGRVDVMLTEEDFVIAIALIEIK